MSETEISWSGWGDPAKAAPLPEKITALLRDLLGVKPREVPPVALEDIAPRPSRLSTAALQALADVAVVRTDAESRVRHTRGKSTPDLLAIRRGDVSDAPDAVVLPDSHEAVLRVLELATEHRFAVVPFGGGTSVVGGLAPDDTGFAGFVALDLRHLDGLVAVDPVSRTATLEPGLRGPRAEELLAEHGFTLGHFPQSFEWASIGGFAAARSSGQSSAGYGRFDENVVGLTVATPTGTLTLGRTQKSAAGPDLRQLVLGSEGAFGVITSVTVRVRPVPEVKVYEGWRFPDFATGSAALRRIIQDGPVPTVLRLSDETETLVNLAQSGAIGEEGGNGCLAIVGFEGEPREVAERRARVREILAEQGGTDLGEGPGEGWAHGRFAAPYLRDSLLDVGAFVETLETTTFWSNIPELYKAVLAALPGHLVMCHISHVYPSAASLYFTIVTPDIDWDVAKPAVNAAILAAGGSISHHHGVGTDHRAPYAEEIGPLGVEILRAVKARLDPAGVLNPGVLVP
ncbi:FAD-binding oxidoreductase [Actinocorallia sp. A-T 12471]|uniref:FAD-binding oxidoreductase n=1 Tax=Actinocorallia sp. A-T 12471 TaxID=3089813 RepID=UPI0029CFBF08|nr:FAD-binding oxidoreductase [Actinocorallia sp. A-T 12471]MDX6739504.1 FAD-binding oxidoreductase [Actinocorallia sp. A-T 12471]